MLVVEPVSGRGRLGSVRVEVLRYIRSVQGCAISTAASLRQAIRRNQLDAFAERDGKMQRIQGVQCACHGIEQANRFGEMRVLQHTAKIMRNRLHSHPPQSRILLRSSRRRFCELEYLLVPDTGPFAQRR